jgi:Methyltransferase domain
MDAAAWDQRYASTELVWTAGPNRFVAAELADLPPGRALDLATGEARNAIWLAGRGWRVRGVDFSQVALDKAARLAAQRGVEVELERADVTARPTEPLAYDLVLVAYLQLPWRQMEPVLEAAAESVAAGGTLLLVGHDLDNLARGVGGPRDPDVLYRADRMAAVLAAGGLIVDRAGQVDRPVDTPEGERAAIDTLVRAHRA